MKIKLFIIALLIFSMNVWGQSDYDLSGWEIRNILYNDEYKVIFYTDGCTLTVETPKPTSEKQIKYRCPNGCEGAEYIEHIKYMHYTFYSLIESLYWECDKCSELFRPTNWFATAKAYNDSVENAKDGDFDNIEIAEPHDWYDNSLDHILEETLRFFAQKRKWNIQNKNKTDITDSYYPGNPKYTWNGNEWVRKQERHIYIHRKVIELNAPFPALYSRIDSLEKRIEELENILEGNILLEEDGGNLKWGKVEIKQGFKLTPLPQMDTLKWHEEDQSWY